MRRPGLRLASKPLLRGTISVAVAVSVVVAAAAWLVGEGRAAERRSERIAALESLARTTADAVGSLLAAEDLSGARRLVLGAGSSVGASCSRVQLPDGRILADMVPSRIDQAALPDPWPVAAALVDAGDPPTVEALASVRVPVDVDAGRKAVLTIETAIDADAARHAEALGLGLAAGAAAGAGLFVFLRRSTRALAIVGDAVADAAMGEPHAEALLVDERLGVPGPEWNALVVGRLAAGAETRPADRAPIEGPADQDGRGVCETLWHGVLVVDAQRRVRYLNGAAALLCGIARDDAVGTDAERLLGSAEVVEAVVRAAAGDRNVRLSIERHTGESDGNGDVLRYSVRTLQRCGATDAAFVLIEDVTQQRLADRSHSAFVAQATHELRTPLTSIRLYVDELIEESDPSPEARGRALEVISHETGRLERMVSDMLSIAEIEAGTMRLRSDDVRIEPMMAALELDFRVQAVAKGVGLEFRLPPKYPHLVGDRDRIQMVLANLLGNAIKYTPSGGSVTVTLGGGSDELRIDVADTGMGIADEEQELVFRSFYRAKDGRVGTIEGTGLGLAIARQIARLHGGDIELRSVVDQGSTFTLRLPVRAPLAVAA